MTGKYIYLTFDSYKSMFLAVCMISLFSCTRVIYYVFPTAVGINPKRIENVKHCVCVCVFVFVFVCAHGRKKSKTQNFVICR